MSDVDGQRLEEAADAKRQPSRQRTSLAALVSRFGASCGVTAERSASSIELLVVGADDTTARLAAHRALHQILGDDGVGREIASLELGSPGQRLRTLLWRHGDCVVVFGFLTGSQADLDLQRLDEAAFNLLSKMTSSTSDSLRLE